MEQKSEYQRLEIEVIDYEYEDVITTSGTKLPEYPVNNSASFY